MTSPAEKLLTALARRRALGLPDAETDVYRVADGAGDGLPGIYIDDCAGHWLVQTQDVPWPAWLAETRGWRSLHWKRLDQQQKEAPRHMAEFLKQEPAIKILG